MLFSHSLDLEDAQGSLIASKFFTEKFKHKD